ncbi:cupin domain-containing protein [Sporomusa malonica]|uniref:Cupin domain-containing protein n=1 Tax=Sporomusa malonica TaxID=112901 RepID=A0A1W2BUP6_9FIRM|nr:cupin domain-containing protein [Sporomusa malonica]SMC76703.1 Cupin domain-containing protein [Sporomusa malonica]
MHVVNVLENMAKTPIDPEVGIAIVEGMAEPGVSMGLAVVKDRIRPHYQKVSDELYYILRGQGIITIGGERQELREGDVVAIPKGQVHGFVNTGKEPCLVLFSSGPKFEADKDRFFPENI